MNIKKRIIDWFRYHHFHTNPARESHHEFMGVLGFLEDYAGKKLAERDTFQESWDEMKAEINKLSEAQINELSHQIDRAKSERFA